jgi:aryl-alcohol dehydrogenase-like predicted oxidoreductase
MKMNRLGRTEMMVSEICLGTMTWGEQNTEADAHEQMDYALAQGVNFFDTAEMYPTQPTRAKHRASQRNISAAGSGLRASATRLCWQPRWAAPVSAGSATAKVLPGLR